jgi:hypothetical protein
VVSRGWRVVHGVDDAASDFVVLTDPDGNRFCIVDKSDS